MTLHCVKYIDHARVSIRWLLRRRRRWLLESSMTRVALWRRIRIISLIGIGGRHLLLWIATSVWCLLLWKSTSVWCLLLRKATSMRHLLLWIATSMWHLWMATAETDVRCGKLWLRWIARCRIRMLELLMNGRIASTSAKWLWRHRRIRWSRTGIGIR